MTSLSRGESEVRSVMYSHTAWDQHLNARHKINDPYIRRISKKMVAETSWVT